MADKFNTLVKRVMKARARGLSWKEIQEEGICTRGQIAPIRKAMRKIDPNTVSNSGPKATKKRSAKKTAAKKTAAKKKATSKKKSTKKVA